MFPWACLQVIAGDSIVVMASIRRGGDEDDEDGAVADKVISQRFSKQKATSYWLVVGDLNTNSVLSIKRTTVFKSTQV